MAQYRSDTKKLDPALQTRFETFVLADGFTTTGMGADAFGRLKVGNPFTLFDSQHRYELNKKFDREVTGGASFTYNDNESAVNSIVTTASGDKVVSQSKRVFAYQPGKSLLIMLSFAFNTPKANLTQRIGYFGANNGVYLEQANSNVSIVLRSFSSGTLNETRIPQSQWNYDTFDGNGYSGQNTTSAYDTGIDLSKANLFWMDLEWLGVGGVRTGFVVDGKFCPAHIFHNTNRNPTTYMTTACLPIRAEIFNTGTTDSSSTLKTICSTVISEGGYQGRNKSFAVGQDLGSATLKDLTNQYQWYPVTSIKLANTRPDAIVIPKLVEIIGVNNNIANFKYKVLVNATLTGASWQTANSSNNVVYDTNSSSFTGGTEISSGYFTSGQKGGAVSFGSLEEFELQLGRTISGNSDIFTVAVQSDTAGADVGAVIEWYELI